MRWKLAAVLLFCTLLLGIHSKELSIEPFAHFVPEYDMVDLGAVLAKDVLSEADYELIYLQTGLGRLAVEQLFAEKEDPYTEIFRHQQDFFRPILYECNSFVITTHQERIVDRAGKRSYGFRFAPLQTGDVLVTKSSHSFGWRNGHAGIVTDAKTGETLEAVTFGSNSKLMDVNDWRAFPAVMVLRLTAASEETRAALATEIRDYANDLPYRLLTGLFWNKQTERETIKGTHCAHLVWTAFYWAGFDIDSDGGWLVTCHDIANSPLFEVVQVYGMDPRAPWE